MPTLSLVNTNTKHTTTYRGGKLDVEVGQEYELSDGNGSLVMFKVVESITDNLYKNISKIDNYYFCYRHIPHYQYEFMFDDTRNNLYFVAERGRDMIVPLNVRP